MTRIVSDNLRITKHLATFISRISAPNSLVENPEFKSFVHVLDYRYPVPGRSLMSKELDKLESCLKQNIQGYIAEAQKVSLCPDIWSKRPHFKLFENYSSFFLSKRPLQAFCNP